MNTLAGLIVELDVRRIHPPRLLLRKKIGNIDELATSVSERGLLQPIVVRPRDQGYEIVAGNRRYAVCKKLGMTKIPCHVMELDDKEALEASIIENVQHCTLDPLEEGEAFKKYVTDFGYGGMSELARKIGKSHSYVSRRISLLKLPTEIKEELVRGRTSSSVAQELISLQDDDRRAIAGLIVEGGITRNEIRRVIKQEVEHDEPFPSYCSQEERIRSMVDKALSRYVVSLRICLLRLDDIVNSFEDDTWFCRDILIEHRWQIHKQIDTLLKLKKKTRHVQLPL